MNTKEQVRTWKKRAKTALISAILIGFGLIIGTYMVAPNLAKGQDGYVPKTVSQMPVKVIQFTHLDGTTTFLPVRIAETIAARKAGLREVGSGALGDLLLLYDHRREVSRFNYQLEDIRAPLEMAIINADGESVLIEKTALGDNFLLVLEAHTWALAAKSGLISELGIEIGSVMAIDIISMND